MSKHAATTVPVTAKVVTPITHTAHIATHKIRKAEHIRKMHIHLMCFSAGVIIAIALTFVRFTPTVDHVAVMLPALPAAAQAIFDRLFRL